jgi:uracil-DNA glycosylase
MKFREQLHPSWRKLLQADLMLLDEIEAKIALEKYLPDHSLVMRALSYDFRAAKVLILGQDPYPNPIYPTGLAFSVPSDAVKIPSSLKNIFQTGTLYQSFSKKYLVYHLSFAILEAQK